MRANVSFATRCVSSGTQANDSTCNAMRCYAVSCYTTRCFAMLRYSMLRNSMIHSAAMSRYDRRCSYVSYFVLHVMAPYCPAAHCLAFFFQ
eukprot:5644159-Pyramimonas_sp.AAC.1